MIPMLIAAGVSAATTIAGNIAKSRSARAAAEKEQAMLDKEKAENAALYNRRYYEDGTQRADVRRALTEASRRLRRENMAASGRAAVMGGTNAEVAAQKAANAEAYGQAVSAAAATADARKDAVETNYLTQRAALNRQQLTADQRNAEANQQAIDTAVNGVNSAASNYIAGNYKRN